VAAAREDDRIARERALAEAKSRARELEKTAADLRKLIEIRNQQLAELEKRAAAAQAAPPVAPVAKPAVQPPPKPAVETPPKPAVEAPKPAAEAPPKPAVEAPKPAPMKPKPAAKPRPAPPPPAVEPSLIDEYLRDPVMLGGLGGVGLLLIGYAAYAWRKKKRAARSQFNEALLGVSVGGGTDLSNAAAAQAEEAAAAAASEEVDPLAEADVFMAYGRDAQAEEILSEALQKGAGGSAIYAKLLQIYAKRHDTKQFEAAALTLKGLVNGEGTEWDKAMALGRSIDPDNALYGRGETAAGASEADLSDAPEVDFDLDAITGSGQMAAGATTPPPVDFDIDTTSSGVRRAAEIDMTLDFDLGGVTTEEPTAAEPAPPEGGAEPAAERGGIDFDLGGTTTERHASADAAPGIDAAQTAPPDSAGGPESGMSLEFEGGEAAPRAQEPAPASVDTVLSTISFELEEPDSAGTNAAGAAAQADEVATKLHLAKAFEEIGDNDSARELLNEVVKEGNPAQQAQAQQMLASLE
jgi:pilus assembly protein FimV